MKSLAIRYNLAVILLAHPSLSGMASGSGLSGSTAWHGSVRSRLYLEHLKESGEAANPDLRRLTVKKANYGPGSGEILLRWEAGRFVPLNAPSPVHRFAMEQAADEKFIQLLVAFDVAGRRVSDASGKSYAPSQFAADPRSDGISKKGYEAAMRRLFAAGRIRMTMSGPPSRERRRLEVVQP